MGNFRCIKNDYILANLVYQRILPIFLILPHIFLNLKIVGKINKSLCSMILGLKFNYCQKLVWEITINSSLFIYYLTFLLVFSYTNTYQCKIQSVDWYIRINIFIINRITQYLTLILCVLKKSKIHYSSANCLNFNSLLLFFLYNYLNVCIIFLNEKKEDLF